LELTACSLEGIADRHKSILMRTGGGRIAVDDDVWRAWQGYMNAYAIDIAFVMAMLRAADDDSRRRDALIELLKLVHLLPNSRFDGVGMANVLEGDLDGHLHKGLSSFLLLVRYGSALAGAWGPTTIGLLGNDPLIWVMRIETV
jgi:hypothetical protein